MLSFQLSSKTPNSYQLPITWPTAQFCNLLMSFSTHFQTSIDLGSYYLWQITIMLWEFNCFKILEVFSIEADITFSFMCHIFQATWFVLYMGCAFLRQTLKFSILESNQIWNNIKLKTKQKKTNNLVPYEKKWVICSMTEISQSSYVRILALISYFPIWKFSEKPKHL